MPQQIDLSATPNQSLNVTLDNLRYTIDLRTLPGGTVVATISRDGVVVMAGHRVVPNRFLFPYAYMRGPGGNFMLMTDGQTLPDWRLFGTSHVLLYYSAAELA